MKVWVLFPSGFSTVAVHVHPLGLVTCDFRQIRRLQQFRRLASQGTFVKPVISSSLRSCVCDLMQFVIQRILKPNIASAQSPLRRGDVIWLFLFFARQIRAIIKKGVLLSDRH